MVFKYNIYFLHKNFHLKQFKNCVKKINKILIKLYISIIVQISKEFRFK